jgi:hypothetical protein
VSQVGCCEGFQARNVPFLRPRWFQLNPPKCFEKNGGDDGTRARGLCHDSGRRQALPRLLSARRALFRQRSFLQDLLKHFQLMVADLKKLRRRVMEFLQ